MGQASEAELRSEARTANKLFFFAFMLVAVGVVAFLLWGLPALTMIGLLATLSVYVMLVAYATGF